MKDKFTRSSINKILIKAGIKEAQKITALVIDSMAAALIEGQTIELRGFGTFTQRERKAQTRHNPKTMERVNVPKKRVIFFRPSGALKSRLNSSLVVALKE